MQYNTITRHFIKHIVVTDIFVILILWLYNLLSLITPLNRIRIGTTIIFLLLIDACLIAIKLVNNFNFGPNRKM